MDDALALEALLELSQKLNSENPVKLPNKKFPLLDNATVQSAMGAVAFIVEKKHKRSNQSLALVKKWCDVRGSGLLGKHLSWMGYEFDRLTTIECFLAVCDCLLDLKSIQTNWWSLELQQQQALSLAIMTVVNESETAKKLSTNLFELIINDREQVANHQDFLDEIWHLKGVLGLSLNQVELLVQNSPHSLEKQLLNFAKDMLQSNCTEVEVPWGEEEENLINLCTSSRIVFQITSSILMQLVLKSQAHQNIVNVLTDFVRRCTSDEKNIVKLFPPKCQVALALLSIPPEKSDCESHVGFLLDAMSDVQPSTAALLLILNPKWLPFLGDKLLT